MQNNGLQTGRVLVDQFLSAQVLQPIPLILTTAGMEGYLNKFREKMQKKSLKV